MKRILSSSQSMMSLLQAVVVVAALYGNTEMWFAGCHAQSSSATVVGTFSGTTRSGSIAAGVLDGDPYLTMVDVDDAGSLRVYLPDFGCSTDFDPPTSVGSEGDTFEFDITVTSGSCLDTTGSTIEHIGGTQWLYQWEIPDADLFGSAMMTYQCQNECQDENTICNSSLDEGELNACIIPRSSVNQGQLQVGPGRFSGTTRSGIIGQPVSGASFITIVDIDETGRLQVSLPGSGCSTDFDPPTVADGQFFQFNIDVTTGSCLDADGATMEHIGGSQWLYQLETSGRYGSAILTYQCLNDCGDNAYCNSSLEQNRSPGECIPYESLDEKNTFNNNVALCPFPSLAPADENDQQSVSVDVYSDISSTGTVNGEFSSESDNDETATNTVITGTEVYTSIDGCVTDLAVQKQGDEVCFSYQYQNRETTTLIIGTAITNECRQTCIAIGSSSSIEVERDSTFISNSAGSLSRLILGECRIVLQDLGSTGTMPDDGGTSTPQSTPPPTAASTASPTTFPVTEVPQSTPLPSVAPTAPPTTSLATEVPQSTPLPSVAQIAAPTTSLATEGPLPTVTPDPFSGTTVPETTPPPTVTPITVPTLSARCLADDTTLFENNPGLANARNLVQELESTYIDNCFSGIGSDSSCTISLDAVDDTYQNECTVAGAKYLVCDYVMFCSSFSLSFDFTHVPECWASSCQDGNLESYTDLLYRDIADGLNLSLDAGCVIDTNDVNCAVVNRAPPIVSDPEEAINIDEGKSDFNVESSSAAVSYGFVGSLASVMGVIVAASFN